MRLLKGITIATGVGVVSYTVARLVPALDALFLALISGILLRGVLSDELKKSAELVTLPLISVGIVTYSSNLDFSIFKSCFFEIIAKVLVVQAVFFVSVLYMGRIAGIGRRLSMLIASGSAICGASAIAVISPLIKARKGDTSTAIMVITAVGLTGALIYPILKGVLHLSPSTYYFLAGATLHQVALVKIACINSGLPPDAALFYKGIRIATLVIFAIIAQYIANSEKPEIPWFIVAFVVLGFGFSFVEALRVVKTYIQPISTVLFASALASIGINVDMREVFEARLRSLNVAYFTWVIALLVALGMEVIS